MLPHEVVSNKVIVIFVLIKDKYISQRIIPKTGHKQRQTF